MSYPDYPDYRLCKSCVPAVIDQDIVKENELIKIVSAENCQYQKHIEVLADLVTGRHRNWRLS